MWIVLDSLHQFVAHHRKLTEVLGGTINIGAQIKDMGMPCFRGQHRNNGRTVDAWNGLQNEFRDRHQGAGIAGTDAGICSPVLHHIDGNPHGRILLAAKRFGGRLMHFDRFTGMAYLDPI